MDSSAREACATRARTRSIHAGGKLQDWHDCHLSEKWEGFGGVGWLEYDAPVQAQTGEVALNASTLWWGMLFGSIGLGFFVYGRKQRVIVPLVCGVALMAFPYFVTATAWLIIVGVALMAIPYFVRI